MPRLVSGLISILLSGLPQTLRAATPDDFEFFEKRIRPVLVQHCSGCHSTQAGKSKGGLLLDSRAALRQGGETGPAIVPGEPGKSLLLQALRYEGPQMPPKGQLPATVLADFERWIAMGAPDPREQASGSTSTIDFAKARQHWAYQPIRRPPLPSVRNSAWVQNPIDQYLLARMESAGISPSAPATRHDLLRRAYQDLIGLPPTYEDVKAFEADRTPAAFARVVDRLLASPHYGERWGRHWLDVARYADTKDLVLLFGPDRVRPYAYTYRDYVVRAFNEDVTYDRFIQEQLAADQLDLHGERWRLGAMGYLTLGRLFDNNLHDIYDDQIDAISRGLLGLTVACARCHDHKYDAIPTADYYSLYGVFASSEPPIDLPLLAEPNTIPGAETFEKQLAAKRQELDRHIETQYEQILHTARLRVGDYLLKIATDKPDPLEDAIFFMSLSPEDLKPQMVSRWRSYLKHPAREVDPAFGPWFDFMRIPEGSFGGACSPVLSAWLARSPGIERGQINPLVREALAAPPLQGRADVARRYGVLLRHVYEISRKLPANLNPAERQLLAPLVEEDGPVYFPKRNAYLYMARVERTTHGSLLQQLDTLAVKSPSAPPRAMVLVDSAQLCQPRIFVRGNAGQPGEQVPRQFLRILAGEQRKPFTHGSGRLELAKAITAPDNPLTSRVIVNRIWMHHFGEPLVSTPSDFGTRSTPPLHSDLLDYLACTLQEDGWSLKKLHRRIVLSRAYQQASFDRPECRQRDPDNHLLWRFPRQRLEFEQMRDSLLALSDRLNRTMGGRPVDVAGDASNCRRTLYGLVDRQDLPGLYRAFDFAVPDQSVERRPLTTTPQQALFALNSVFVTEQAKALMTVPMIQRETNSTARIEALYRRVFARDATDSEVRRGMSFVSAARIEAGADVWQQYAQVLLVANEMMFVD